MGIQWTQPILRGVKMASFLLMTAIVSSLIVIESPGQTNAEGLLNRVVCTVGILLQKTCVTKPVETTVPPQTPQPTPAPPSEVSQSTPAPPSGTPTVQTQDAQPVAPAPEPLKLEEDLVKELPQVVGPTVTRHANHQYPAHVLMSTYYRPSGGEVLGVSRETPYLEATDQGWRFFGLLWYWWIVMATALVGLAYLIRTTVTKPFLSIVK